MRVKTKTSRGRVRVKMLPPDEHIVVSVNRR